MTSLHHDTSSNHKQTPHPFNGMDGVNHSEQHCLRESLFSIAFFFGETYNEGRKKQGADKDMTHDFLTRHGMAAEQVELPSLCRRFQEEMDAGLAGKPSTILMLPTYLSVDGTLPRNEPVAVIDAGGTNARVAKVTFTHGGATVENSTVFPVPGSRGEVTREGFVDAFAEALSPFVADCKAIGFCFSFPARITPQRDGEVLYFDKEVRVSDAPGMLLLHELNTALEKRGIPPRPGVVLNDTVAALLGGMFQTEVSRYDGFVGLIYGTGLNTCYSEAVESIGKLEGSLGGTMLINTESGAFGKVCPGTFDRRLDGDSRDPGHHLYEKMVSGAYLGEVVRYALAGAAEEGLLPDRFRTIPRLETYEADGFVASPTEGGPLAALCRTDGERQFVLDIISALSRRAARLVCGNLAAILLRAGLGKDPARPACIVAEGSTLYKSRLLFPCLEAEMAAYVGGDLGLHYTFLRPENANLMGAAAAALLNG